MGKRFILSGSLESFHHWACDFRPWTIQRKQHPEKFQRSCHLDDAAYPDRQYQWQATQVWQVLSSSMPSNVDQMRDHSWIQPTTHENYIAHAKKNGFEPKWESLPSGLKAYWIGDPKAEKTMVFFHGRRLNIFFFLVLLRAPSLQHPLTVIYNLCHSFPDINFFFQTKRSRPALNYH